MPSLLLKHQDVSAALLLVLVLHICFFPFIWGNKTLLGSAYGEPSVMPNGAYYGTGTGPAFPRTNDMDAATWLPEPYAQLVREQYFHERNLPLWNPYQSYGAPMAANMQSQPFYPLFILLALHPGPRAVNFFFLARFLLVGLFTYLYLRLFLPFISSITGGIAGMLSGYYILFFNMPEVSVNLMLPALFLTAERLLRSHSVKNTILSAAATFFCIVGGMPESAFLILMFAGGYYLFRVITGYRSWAPRLTQVKYFAISQALGLTLAAFLLLPFFEYMAESFNTHVPANIHGRIQGLTHDTFGPSIFTYLIPLVFGPAWRPLAPGLGGLSDLRGFIGVVQLLLVFVAADGAIKRSSESHTNRHLTLFFLVSAAVIILKRYGAPLINWIGYLPFCQYVLFQKYDEPLLALACSVLCAYGAHRIFTGAVSRSRLAILILAVFTMLLAAGAYSLAEVVAAHPDSHLYYLSLGIGLAALFLMALILLAPNTTGSRAWLPAALLLLLTAEMAGAYVYPVYNVLTRSTLNDRNPYLGAPYIDYLRNRLKAHERIFGRKGVLHPNWASAFQLTDIRDVDALYYHKYLTFVRNFLHEEIPADARGDLVMAFTGARWLASDSMLKTRLLQLSSTRFLLSPDPYQAGTGSVQVAEILRQNEGRLAHGRENLVEFREFSVTGVTKAVLYEHPPYDRLPFRTAVTPANRTLSFNVAMQPAVYDGTIPLCGDGVEFRLEARDSKGQTTLLYKSYIDPKHDPAARRWFPVSVDLSRYLWQTIELLFTTSPGPAGDSCADWAGWGDLKFTGDAGPPAFRLVYDREIKIYEYEKTLPRAALFSNVEVVPDDKTALAKLADPAFDIFHSAVVASGDLVDGEFAAIQTINALPPEPVRPARMTEYTSQSVAIEASTERPSMLVLNDSDYPGWKAYVDGHPVHLITANYLFRGVLLPPGRHLVRFRYSPMSFLAGAMISGTSVFGVAAFVLWRKRAFASFTGSMAAANE